MAIVDTPLFRYPDFASVYVLNLSNQAISASTHIVGYVMQIPRSGTLNGVRFRTATVTTGDTVRVSFQNVSASTGDPDGSIDQYRNVTILSTDDNAVFDSGLITSDGTDLGIKRTVTRGELLCVCFDFPSYTSGNLQIANVQLQDQSQSYQSYFNGTSWTKSTTFGPNLLLNYQTDGLVATPGSFLCSAFDAATFNSSSTPDERANKIIPTVGLRVVGVIVRGDFDGECDIVLYDSDGSTVLASVSIDPDVRLSTAVNSYTLRFNTDVTLTANSAYYLSIKPTTTTNVGWRGVTFFSSTDKNAIAGFSNICRSTRTDAGSWTDDTSGVVTVCLLCDGVETGGGSGGVPLIGTGGLVY